MWNPSDPETRGPLKLTKLDAPALFVLYFGIGREQFSFLSTPKCWKAF